MSARNGSIVGSAGFAPGIVGDAFSFDGNGWIDVDDDPIWTLGTKDFTIDLWVRFNSLSGRDPFIAHNNGGGQEDKWIFWYDAGGHDKQLGVPALRFHINGSHFPAAHDTVVASWNPLLERWYHVAVTRSGSSYALYIDGAQVATDTSNVSIPDPVVPLTIGRAEAFRLNGLVDEVGIFERALSASEIQAIFDAGSAGKCKEVTVTIDIDIKPGSDPNSINLRANGVLPVAIVSSEDVDALEIDEETVLFGDPFAIEFGNGAPVSPLRSAVEDVDGDGLDDLLLFFSIPEIADFGALDEESVVAMLTGKTFDGTPIDGMDEVRIVPPPAGGRGRN